MIVKDYLKNMNIEEKNGGIERQGHTVTPRADESDPLENESKEWDRLVAL